MATIALIPTARSSAVVSSRGSPRRRPPASSSATVRRCQSAGNRPSTSSSRTEHST